MLLRWATYMAGACLLVLMFGHKPVQAQAIEYQPIGIRTGSILLFPVVQVREGYNDNIFREDINETDSFVTEIMPSLVAITDWEEAEILVESGAQFGVYAASPDDNYIDAFVSADAVRVRPNA